MIIGGNTISFYMNKLKERALASGGFASKPHGRLRFGPISEKEIVQLGENLASVHTDFKLLEKIPAYGGLRL
jgi:hypothetical protein